MSVESDALQKLDDEWAGYHEAPPPLRVELHRRAEHLAPLNWRKVLSSLSSDDEQSAAAPRARSRAVESPLQTGVASAQEIAPGSALTVLYADDAPAEAPARAQDPVAALITAIVPVVQRILHFFDSGEGSGQHRAAKPALDLAPMESSMVELKTQYGNLRDEVVEHISTLKRAETKLQMVREATERNTTEKQELIQALRGVRRKTNILTTFTLGMLAVSILIEIAMFLYFPIR